MGCGCCEETEETEHKHEHCGKEMECKDNKYFCVECGFEEECDCGDNKTSKETEETKDDSDSEE